MFQSKSSLITLNLMELVLMQRVSIKLTIVIQVHRNYLQSTPASGSINLYDLFFLLFHEVTFYICIEKAFLIDSMLHLISTSFQPLKTQMWPYIRILMIASLTPILSDHWHLSWLLIVDSFFNVAFISTRRWIAEPRMKLIAMIKSFHYNNPIKDFLLLWS